MKAVLVSALSASLAAGATACDSRPTPAECTSMLDKYVDMIVAGGVAAEDLSPPDALAAREARKAKKKADPTYRQVHEQCVAEISRREYRCAMKAPTPETWQACID